MQKEILKKAIIIGLYATIITLIVFVLLIKYICINLLNQKLAYTPLYASITIIPFSMLNSVYRGYFNGKNKKRKFHIEISFFKPTNNQSIISAISKGLVRKTFAPLSVSNSLSR